MPAPDPHTLHVQQLFISHQTSLKGFVLALEPRMAEAEDVLQDVFLVVTETAGKFENGSSFFAWACTIARFKLMEQRRRTGRVDVGLSEEALCALEASAPAPAFFDERLRLLKTCTERLAPRAREIVRLRYQNEHGAQEIARRLGWTANAVSVALSRAREALRECVQHPIQSAKASL